MSGESYRKGLPRRAKARGSEHSGLKGQAELAVTGHIFFPPRSAHSLRPLSQSPVLCWSHSRADPETPQLLSGLSVVSLASGLHPACYSSSLDGGQSTSSPSLGSR